MARASWRQARRRRNIRRALIALGAAAAVAAVFALLAGYRLVGAAQDLRAARSLLESAEESISEGRVSDARSALAEASGRLIDAQRSLSKGRLELDVVRALPIAGDNLVDLRQSVTLAAQLASGGVRILDAAGPLIGANGTLDVSLAQGQVPLEPVAAVLSEIELLRTSLPVASDLDDDPGLLVGPVQDLHDRIVGEVVDRRAQLDNLSAGLSLLYEMAGGLGDRGYLIAVANTSEMRGSGGMVLSYGGLLGVDGKFTLPAFGRIDDLFLDDPITRESVRTVPDDYLARWDGFEPLRLWRNANLAADFSVVAPVLLQMGTTAAQAQLDGVIQIDPQGLAALLEGVGPIEVDEIGEVNADNVVDLVLHDAYVKYPGIQSRSDVLEEVARGAFTKLVNGDFPSLRPLGAALTEAVRGRHLMMHATTPAAEVWLDQLGARGTLPDPQGPDSFHLSVQNVSANKLDYFVDTAVELTGDRSPRTPSRIQAKVVVRNSATPGTTQPSYIYGPFDRSQQAGLYRAVVSLYLPAGTNVGPVTGDPTRYPAISVSEDGRPLVSYTIDLPAGQRHEAIIELELAPRKDEPYELILVPAPRVRPTIWRLGIETGRGFLAQTIPLEESLVVPAEAEPVQWRPGDSE
ncbi:MAG: DUF4012 domain-containing protein [Actinomycetota bacterium]|nr:DUF4012 domain-containing protein [Actinomycetota bacterium]